MNKENGKIDELMKLYNTMEDYMSVWGAVTLLISIMFFSYNEILQNNLKKNARTENKKK